MKIAVAFSIVVASTSGCPGCVPVDPDGGPGPDPIIAFSTPRDGFVLNNADDKDGDPENGIQLDVRVRYSGAEGTTLTLTSDQGESATADTDAGFATFTNFTIASSTTGLVNVLTATDGDVSGSISVTGRYNLLPPPECTFLVPSDAAILASSADANTALAGYQFAVRLSCVGSNVAPGLEVELSAGGASVFRTLDASLEVNALVTAATVPGFNTVTATLRNGATVLDETSITISIVDTPNICTITQPANNALLTVDADPATGGFQIDVAVECEGPNVFSGQTLSVNAGAAPATTSLTGAAAPFTAGVRVTAAGSGANTLTATLQGGIASAAIVVTVGVESPFCEFVMPGPNAPVTGDLDAVTPGIQFEAMVHCGDLATGTTVTVTGGESDVSGTIDAGGDVVLVVTVADEGEYTLTATAPGAEPVTTTFTVSILTLCDATITAPADGTVFDASAIDADLNTPEFDIGVELSTDPSCVGAIARVTNGTDIFEATVAADGSATVLVTLADGVHALVGEVASDDGVGASDTVNVTVDRTPASISLTSPSDGAVYGPADDLDNNPANGISLPFTGTITGATSASFALSCGVTVVLGGELPLLADGSFAEVFANLEVGACTLTVNATDGLNQTTLQIAFTVANVSVDVTLGAGFDLAPTGFFIAGEDKNPGTPTTMEIDLDVTATFDTGTYTATFEVVRTSDSVVVQSGSLGALTSGVVATVELALPYGESTAYRVDVTLTPDTGSVVVASETFVVDTVTPTLTWQSPSEGFVYSAASDQSPNAGFQGFFALNTTGHVGQIVNLAFTGASTVNASCTVIASNLCSATVTLIDGSYSVTASASDAAGNVATPAVRAFSVDATLPLVESIVVVADTVDAAGNPGPDGQLNRAENGGLSAPATSNIVVTFAAGAGIEAGRNVTLTRTPGGTSVAQSNGTSVTFTNVVLAEGNISFSVSGTDAALNPTSTANQPFAFRVDTTPPIIGIVSPSGAAITQSPVSIAIGTNAEAGNPVTLTDVTGGGSIPLGTPQVVVAGGATFSGLVLEQGSRTVRASVRDLAGNPATGERTYLVNTIPPALTLSVTSDPTVDADLAAPGFQVTFSVVHTGLEADRIIRLFSNLTGERGSALASGTGTTAITGTFTTSAAHTMTAVAANQAGTVGTSNAVSVDIVTGEFDLIVESPLPSSGTLSFSALDVTGGTARLVVFAPALPLAATTALRLNGVVDGTAVLTRVGDTLTAAFSVTEGQTGTIELTALDGGTTGTTGVYAYVVDAVAPTVAFAAATPTVYGIAQDDAPSVAGLQTTVQIEVTECENGSIEIFEGALAIGGPVEVGPSGAGTFAVEILDTIEHVNATWTARCTDAAGNEGSDDLITTVDLTAPAIGPITTSIIDVRRGQIRVEFAAPGDDGSTGAPVTLQVVASRDAITAVNFDAVAALPKFPGTGGLVDESVSTPAGTTFTAQTEFLAFDNTWNIAVRATDSVGNSAFATVSETGLVTDVWSYTNVENDVGAGAAEPDRFGKPSFSSGDLDGDGFDDLAISAPNEGDTCPFAGYCDGVVRLVAGAADLAGLTVDVTLTGAGTITFGTDATIVPSMDGDAFDDLIVTSYDSTTFEQLLHIYYGSSTPGALVGAEVRVNLGFTYIDTVRPIGDVNGDGFPDVALSPSEGAGGDRFLHVLFGGATRIANGATLATLNHAIVELDGAAPGTRLGRTTGFGNLDGDVNGANPLDDFAIDGTTRVFVVRGRASWPVPPATLLVSTIPVADRVICTQDICGFELASGDVNGDAAPDLVVTNTGGLLVFLGSGGSIPVSVSYQILPVRSPLTAAQSTIVVADTNGDGFDDIGVMVSAGGGSPSEAQTYMGGAYVEGSGLTAGQRVRADGAYELTIDGAGPGRFGSCGDADGDGLEELCFGSELLESFVIRY